MTPKLGKYNLIDQFGQGKIINPNMLEIIMECQLGTKSMRAHG